MDLLSVLVITYLVSSNHPHESEMALGHEQCMTAAKTLQAAIDAPSGPRPKVELMSGRKVPMIAAVCLPACMADGTELALLSEGAHD